MNRTRTVLLWYNNGAERLTLPVNPARINLRRTQNTRELCTIDGAPLHVACGPGLTHISFSTFLPSEHSRFYTGIPPAHALEMLCRWQNGRRPVRLMISGTDVNDSFLLTAFSRLLEEGDEDIGIALELREYRFSSVQGGALTQNPGGLYVRPDDRPPAKTYTVGKGDTLWDIAVCLYGDRTRWKEIAARNGISDPTKLAVGKVLAL